MDMQLKKEAMAKLDELKALLAKAGVDLMDFIHESGESESEEMSEDMGEGMEEEDDGEGESPEGMGAAPKKALIIALLKKKAKGM